MRTRRSAFTILAFDIGSSSTRAALFDTRARVVPGSQSAVSYKISYTGDGGAELSPNQLLRAARACFKHTHSSENQSAPIRAVAGSAFWHGLLGVDHDWKPLTPIYTWADSRAAEAARSLKRRFNERTVHQRTGCMLHASFWPAKLTWLRRTNPRIFQRVSFWVSPVDWIFHRLFGTTDTSPSMASATGLFNLQTRTWDQQMLRACHLRRAQLPSIRTLAKPNERGLILFFPIGDGAASNVGSGAENGEIAINVGTSAAVRMIQKTRRRIPFGLFQYVVDERRYVIGGAISNAGNLRQWALGSLNLPGDAQRNPRALDREAAARDSLDVLPFWAGERAPTWPDHEAGTISGITQSTSATDIARALTSAACYRLADILDLLPAGKAKGRRIIVSGGILRSPAMLPLLADVLGRAVGISKHREASLRGAALCALEQLGMPSPATPAGKRVSFRPKLTRLHRLRRARQRRLEQRLAPDSER